jgi:hypothetical protein
MKRVKSIIKVKLRTALIRILLVCRPVHNYLTSVHRYKVLILDTYQQDTPYLCKKGCVDP